MRWNVAIRPSRSNEETYQRILAAAERREQQREQEAQRVPRGIDQLALKGFMKRSVKRFLRELGNHSEE